MRKIFMISFIIFLYVSTFFYIYIVFILNSQIFSKVPKKWSYENPSRIHVEHQMWNSSSANFIFNPIKKKKICLKKDTTLSTVFVFPNYLFILLFFQKIYRRYVKNRKKKSIIVVKSYFSHRFQLVLRF